MWRDGEGKRAWAEITPFREFGTEDDKAAEHVTTRALGEGPSSVANQSGSGVRDDRSALITGQFGLRRQMAVCGTLKQHPAFESGRAHHRITFKDLLAHRREIRRHQSDRLEKTGEETWLGDGLVQKYAAVERLMLGAHNRQT